MKRLTLALAALLAGTGFAAADPVFGTWKTAPGEKGNYALVTIAGCGDQICGTLGKAYNASGHEITSDKIGRKMIWDMTAKGDGAYAGGKIWAPDSDKTYGAKMQLSGNQLKVSGCVGPICRGQTWTRVQ